MQDSFGTHNQPQYSGTGAPSDAADLSQVANYAAAVGNAKSGTTAQMNALAGADLWPGLLFSNTTDSGLYEYAGAGPGWVRIASAGATPFAMAAGSGSNAAGATTAVTFPVGRFTVAPIVTMVNTGSSVSALNIQGVTATGAGMGGYNSAGTPIASTWMWTAIQMTATTAAG